MICRGPKNVENRTRKWKHVGPVIIHASQKFDHEALERLQAEGHIHESWTRDNFPPGIVGIALKTCCEYREPGEEYRFASEYFDIEPYEWSPWHDVKCYGYYFSGRTHFPFRVKMRGTQFVGNVDDTALYEVMHKFHFYSMFSGRTLAEQAPN